MKNSNRRNLILSPHLPSSNLVATLAGLVDANNRWLDRILRNQGGSHEFSGRRRHSSPYIWEMLHRHLLAQVGVFDADFAHGLPTRVLAILRFVKLSLNKLLAPDFVPRATRTLEKMLISLQEIAINRRFRFRH